MVYHYLILQAIRTKWVNTPAFVAAHPGSEELEWVVDFTPVLNPEGEPLILDANGPEDALSFAIGILKIPRHALAIQSHTKYVETHRHPDPVHGFPSYLIRGNAAANRARRNYSPRGADRVSPRS